MMAEATPPATTSAVLGDADGWRRQHGARRVAGATADAAVTACRTGIMSTRAKAAGMQPRMAFTTAATRAVTMVVSTPKPAVHRPYARVRPSASRVDGAEPRSWLASALAALNGSAAVSSRSSTDRA